MSEYSAIKATIDANIKTNGEQEITGAILNSILNAMVDALGKGYQFIGVATPEINPGTPDEKVFYIAERGEYPNFGLSVAKDELAFLIYEDGVWVKLAVTLAASDFENVEEPGFHVTDNNLNVGMRYDGDGLDFAKITSHAVSLIKSQLGGGDGLTEVEEDGFYVVDAEYNVGLKLDENGLQAKNVFLTETIE